MALFEQTFLGNTLGAWLAAGITAAAAVAVLSLAKRVAQRRVDSQAAAGDVIRTLVPQVAARNQVFFAAVVAVYLGTRWLELPPTVASLITTATVIGVALQIGLWGNTAIVHLVQRGMERRLTEDPASATTVNAFGFVGRLLLWSLLLLLVLANLGLEITPLLAGLGVGGIAVALAVQNVLGDLFASLSIVLDKPFEIGDFIIVGELLGSVEYIGLKTTRIRSLSGEQIVFCNSDLLNSRIRNFKRMYHRRVVFAFGVVYETPYEKLKRIPGMVREIIESRDLVRFDRAHFFKYGEFSLDFEVVYHVLDPDYNAYMDIQQAINLELFRRFDAEGISFAYPTRTLYFHGEARPARRETVAEAVAAGDAGPDDSPAG